MMWEFATANPGTTLLVICARDGRDCAYPFCRCVVRYPEAASPSARP